VLHQITFYSHVIGNLSIKALYPTVVDQKPVLFINSFHTTFNVLTFSDCPYGKLSFFSDCFKHSL